MPLDRERISPFQIESRVPFYLKGHLTTMSKHTNYHTIPLHIDFLDVEELIGQIEIIASPMKVTLIFFWNAYYLKFRDSSAIHLTTLWKY